MGCVRAVRERKTVNTKVAKTRSGCRGVVAFVATVALGMIAALAPFMPAAGFPFNGYGALTFAVPMIVAMVLCTDLVVDRGRRLATAS